MRNGWRRYEAFGPRYDQVAAWSSRPATRKSRLGGDGTRPKPSPRRDVPGVGAVESWGDPLEVDGEYVTSRGTYVFESDGAVLTSDSTLRFRGRDQIEASLHEAGFVVEDVRDAPDRPGLEFVFIASVRT